VEPGQSQECGARGSKRDNPGRGPREGKKRCGSRTHVSLVVAMQNGDGVVDGRGWGSGASGSTRTDEEEKIWGRRMAGGIIESQRYGDAVGKEEARWQPQKSQTRGKNEAGNSARRKSASRSESIKRTQLILWRDARYKSSKDVELWPEEQVKRTVLCGGCEGRKAYLDVCLLL